MSFYRTYRPQIIAEIDNESVRTRLTELLSKDRADLPHAYLFTGPKGTGKTTAARILAKVFNCSALKKTGPCGICAQCLAIANGQSMDVIEMDAASNRGIDEIRQLRERIGMAPVASAYTVYIIDEVHMLTAEAFNALLKTLEEPPKHAVFILATTNREKVPGTIQSRCISVPFTRADASELMHALQRIVKTEHFKAEDSALSLIIRYSDGSFRDAVKYLEQVSLTSKTITVDAVLKSLSLPDVQLRAQCIEAIANSDVRAALAVISRIRREQTDMKSFLVAMLNDLHEMLLKHITDANPKQILTPDQVKQAISQLSLAYAELRVSPIEELPIELAVIELCRKHEELDQPVRPEQNTDDGADSSVNTGIGLLTLPKLTEHWKDFIASCKPYNHSVAGILRSSRPKDVRDGIVTLEAFYSFHRDKLNESKTKQILAEVLKKLFGILLF